MLILELFGVGGAAACISDGTTFGHLLAQEVVVVKQEFRK